MEIQVKREVTFAPADEVFRDVVCQIAAAARRPDFWSSRYELAIATAKISRKIAGPYQDVLTWARHLGSVAIFIDRINRPGSSNADMRSFVKTFRTRLEEAGAAHDDDTVWRLLGRLQILVFDFTAPGSADESLARDRAAGALHSDDAPYAGSLWTILVELALRVAASGGDRTRSGIVEDLHSEPFRLAGERRHAMTRARLGEASRNALDDIGDFVGGVTLLRYERLEQIRAALEAGRYVEVRGDSGVGKSGLLKHLARQIASESRTVVLSPGRTTPRGWLEMRAVLGFDGTARELLADLAGTGGTILFIDNLDRFEASERLTAIDLTRAAADIPGVAIVATARTRFAVEEPNWLPADVLDRLGRAAPVVISELSEAEVEELRHAAPNLALLLTDSHPARQVSRNLFRLARLAARPGGESPRTETEMAEQWWRTADGERDANHRDRARVLRALAERVLAGSEPLDTRDLPSAAVDALIQTETLRDLDNDRVAFRHDVLAEWAIGCLFSSESSAMDGLPLGGPAPPTLARGVELAARSALETTADSTAWQLLLERLSGEGVHGSWRRAVLLALVRSEAAPDILTKASDVLLAERARLLRELIRFVRAVDVLPAAEFFAALGFDPSAVPPHLNTPRGPSWFRLIRWLLHLGEGLPAAAISDVVDLYSDWSLFVLGEDPLTPHLLSWLYRWLNEIEVAPDQDVHFGGDNLGGTDVGDLANKLRTGFVMFCSRTPALAADYLQRLKEGGRHNEQAVKAILKFRGQLAQAASAQLAELTAAALIRQHDENRRRRTRSDEKPFTWIDNEFIPASPSQGPFLELLTHAPQQGLALVRRLVDHAIAFHSGRRPYGPNMIVVHFPLGPRIYPWIESYGWSRGWGRSYAVASALMAVEAWAHQRLEAGDGFDTVLDDVLGTCDTPAVYLLIAVDLLLSHWPASREAAIPFLASPELLCIDLVRLVHDQRPPFPDIFGLQELQREPRGLATLDSLTTRPSRRASLDQLLPYYVVNAPEEFRERLAALLREAEVRLGPYTEDANLGNPAFMAFHASNLLEPANYRDTEIPLHNGGSVIGRQYFPPEAERVHFERLERGASERSIAANMQLVISAALDDLSRSSPEFAQRALEWARTATPPLAYEDGGSEIYEQATVGAAMLAMRDGTPELRDAHREWAQGIFAAALRAEDNPVYRVRDGLQFNPLAISFAGMAYALRGHINSDSIRELLAIVDRPAAAHGFIAAAPTIATIDDRLPRAILRCALAACILPVRKRNEPERARTKRAKRHQQAVVAAEIAWLFEAGEEPTWQAPPVYRPRTRQRRRLPATGDEQAAAGIAYAEATTEKFDYQTAALWLRGANRLLDAGGEIWLQLVLRSYAEWTWVVNGAGLEAAEDLSQTPNEWNDVYFALLARGLTSADKATADRLALEPLASLPDKSFFDAVTRFQSSVDEMFFNNLGLETSVAVYIRSRLAERLKASNDWAWFVRRRSSSVEMRLGRAIATLFFNQGGYFQPATAYLLPPAIDRLMPFLPSLETLAAEGASLSVAIFTLNLLEVSPRSAHLPFLLTVAGAWMAAFPNSTDFWIDHAIGRRVCGLIDAARLEEPGLFSVNQPLREQTNSLLPALIRLGVAEAARLERSLTESD
jgi:energy-coupling factor transporter ATP-binding protein EcfA2